MVGVEDLHKIHILRDMPEDMLKKIGSIATLHLYSADTILFNQHEQLEYFYMVLSGSVMLELVASQDFTITLGVVQPGHTFGISTFIPHARSGSTAICGEPCELIRLSGEKMTELFDQEPELGYNFMLRVVRVFRSVLGHRTTMFINTLAKHPEMQSLFEDLKHLAPIL